MHELEKDVHPLEYSLHLEDFDRVLKMREKDL
jgi:hypothetical protein